MTQSTGAGVKRISIQEAKDRLAAGGARVIDIRMAFDYMGGRIPGSLNLPNNAIRARKGEVPEDVELLFLSETGERSLAIAEMAIALGFERVANIEGGYDAWLAAGNEVETISEGISSPFQQG